MNRQMVWVVFVLILWTGIVFAQNMGKKEIVIPGGKQGEITFPHHMHQGVVNDCMVCHADFSKEPGAIAALKKAGTLRNKQVMNNTCLKCHRDKKKAGEKYGPVKCSGCHMK